MSFCRRCGAALTHVAGNEYRCPNGHRNFAHGAPAIGLFLVNDAHEVLLVVRGQEPGKGKFDVPGGFVDDGETLEETIARELREELHLAPDAYSSPQFLCSLINQYEFGGEIIRPLDCFFWARIRGDVTLHPDDDVAGAQWHEPGTIKPGDFAFRSTPVAFAALKTRLQ